MIGVGGGNAVVNHTVREARNKHHKQHATATIPHDKPNPPSMIPPPTSNTQSVPSNKLAAINNRAKT